MSVKGPKAFLEHEKNYPDNLNTKWLCEILKEVGLWIQMLKVSIAVQETYQTGLKLLERPPSHLDVGNGLL